MYYYLKKVLLPILLLTSNQSFASSNNPLLGAEDPDLKYSFTIIECSRNRSVVLQLVTDPIDAYAELQHKVEPNPRSFCICSGSDWIFRGKSNGRYHYMCPG